MRASLIVCTRNRANRLGTTLEYLEQVDLRDAELIFVNNGSDDHTAEILGQWSDGKENVRITFEPAKGLGRARNTGWKLAQGDVVVFTDDDCYPYPDYVQQHVVLYENAPQLGWVSGRILLHDPEDAKITIQENDYTVHYPACQFLPTGAVHGANISFRRSALEKIDGFDPLMGVGALFPCEDIDAAARVCYESFEGLYSPAPVVYHHHRRQTSEQVAALERDYRTGRGSYYAKCIWNPAMRKAYLRRILGKWRHQSVTEICGEAKAIWNWWLHTQFQNRSSAKTGKSAS